MDAVRIIFRKWIPKRQAEMAKKYPKDIVGIKLAHFSGHTWVPTDRAEEAGRLANLPIMVDFGGANPYLPLDSLFNVKFVREISIPTLLAGTAITPKWKGVYCICTGW